jgi:ABC-type sulfate transport system substrate-binding protein
MLSRRIHQWQLLILTGLKCKIASELFAYDNVKLALALVTYDANRNKYTKIRKAWYTDFQTKRIQSIEPNRVSCTAFSADH